MSKKTEGMKVELSDESIQKIAKIAQDTAMAVALTPKSVTVQEEPSNTNAENSVTERKEFYNIEVTVDLNKAGKRTIRKHVYLSDTDRYQMAEELTNSVHYAILSSFRTNDQILGKPEW